MSVDVKYYLDGDCKLQPHQVRNENKLNPLGYRRVELPVGILGMSADTLIVDEMVTTAKKNDNGKYRTDLIPRDVIKEVAEVFTFGAAKYGDINWRKGMNYSRLYSASQRHQDAFWSGNNIDDESGRAHLAHAICGLMMLYEFTTENKYKQFDDRYIKEEVTQ